MRPGLFLWWAGYAVLLRKPTVRLAREAPVVSLSAGLSRVKRLAFDPTYVAPWIPNQDPDAVTFPPGWYFKDDAWGRVNASLNVTNYSGVDAAYAPVGCHSQYSFATIILGDVSVETTVDYRLMNLSHLESEIRYCVEINGKYNGDYYVYCRDGVLHVENSTCYLDVVPPLMQDFHMGEFIPDRERFNLNDTQQLNMTISEYTPYSNKAPGTRPPITAPWDQFILRFSEAVQAGSGDITIQELNPPSVRRDYKGPAISVPADDYYQVFFGEDEMGIGMAVVQSKDGHLKTKDGGQLYSIDIPTGALLDRAGNPALFRGNDTSIYLEFEVMDIRRPRINQDWIAAFWPRQADTGRFVHHNITITFDEPVFKNKNKPDALIKLEPRLADDVQCYEEFKVHGCGPIYLDESQVGIDLPIWGDQVVMMDDGYTVALYPRGMEYGVTYAVVIENGDFQDGSGLNFTGLGDLENGNYFFTTATMKQMQLREEIQFYMDYDKKRLNDLATMFHVQSVGDIPWVDSFAKLRLLTVTWAIGEAEKILAETYGLPVEFDLQNVVDELKRDRIEPRGVPFSDPWVCEDLQSHFLPSVNFKCGRAVQKSGNGFDIATRTATFYYREGCLCESFFVNACPFPLTATQTYREFGFVAMDQKVISPGHSLCWYWSLSSNPEWGYLSSPSNYFNATDPADDERLVKQFWSWEAAHRPYEAAARDMVADHVASQSLVHRGAAKRRAARARRAPPLPTPAPTLPPALRGFRLRRRLPRNDTHVPQVPVRVREKDVMDAVMKALPGTPFPPELPPPPPRYPEPPGVGAEALPPGVNPAPTGSRVPVIAPRRVASQNDVWNSEQANLAVLYHP